MAKGSLFHWGPLTALTIIFTLFIASVYSSLVWWPPVNFSGIFNIGLLVLFLFCILYNFIKAAWVGPGYVPLQWRPDNIEHEKLMQFCQICEGFKAPRSHHCRHCNRCVMKMDHHCPWINNCVGHKNHKRFTLFLFFVVIGCSYAAISLIGCVIQIFSISINMLKDSLREALFKSGDIKQTFSELLKVNPMMYRKIMEQQLVPFGFYHLLGTIFSIGLDIGVTLAVGILLYYQARDIIRNESSIESWIVEKATYRSKKDRRFIYPYNLGRRENIMQVIHFQGDYIGDGITWPVVDGCNQYTLTIEQLRQKRMKKRYAVDYKSVAAYSGSFCGWQYGIRTCIAYPWTLEKRLIFEKEQNLLVTRFRKHWLYGVKVQDDQSSVSTLAVKDPEKGWFPKCCAVQIDDNHGLVTSEEKSKDQ